MSRTVAAMRRDKWADEVSEGDVGKLEKMITESNDGMVRHGNRRQCMDAQDPGPSLPRCARGAVGQMLRSSL